MQILLNLLAGVALLVWGTHIVRTDILRLYGGDLRRVLRQSVANRFAAFGAGLAVTALLQSSTATALIVASFVGQGLIATAPALSVMLGADVGTSLMVLLFSFDLSWLSPFLIFAGVVLFLHRENSKIGRFGRILVGLGLIIMALQWIVLTTKPITQAAGVKVIFASLTGDLLLDMLVGAVFAVLSYSSLAVVLLTAALAASKVIGVHVALALVLGANLGSGVMAMLNTLHSTPEARRVTLGNFLFKLIGCIAFAPFLDHVETLLAAIDPSENRLVVHFHLVFNVAIAVAFVFFTEQIARVATRLMPAKPDVDDPGKPRYLDPSALATPALAIGNAAREAMRIGDVIEQMLTGMLTVLRTNDRALAQRLRKMDDIVDDLYTAIKLYLTQISHEALEEKEGRRWADIVSFTINMEQVGDIIERIINDLEEKKIDKGRSFSTAGMEEICDLHARLVANLRLGMSVFLHGDLKSAQQLLAEKVLFRDLERSYADSHISRLMDNTAQSIETSSLHLDLISDLKRINSHICSIAYPILEQAGVLAKTRLKEATAPEVPVAPTGNAAGEDGWKKPKPRTA
ncbi:MAG: Na/Pi cotransporter family protein [Betaproteobacteria bacterium]|nr:MAG: Na/Pi cotransporter family protein [Betaproteobacteria bacterium]